MGDYFKPWRRKVGVLMLLFACTLMIVWVRSLLCEDGVSLTIGEHVSVIVASTNHALGILYSRSTIPVSVEFEFWSTQSSGSVESILGIDTTDEFQWLVRTAGFVFGRSEFDKGRSRCSIVPYWSLVIPLTICAAWMLFYQPRLVEERKEHTSVARKSPFAICDLVRGWQGKMRLILLLMTSVLMGLWICSYWHEVRLASIVSRYKKHDQDDQLISTRGEIVWSNVRNIDGSWPYHGSLSVSRQRPYEQFVFGFPLTWQWKRMGFGYADGQDRYQNHICNDWSVFVIPCWSFTLPLALLSAWSLRRMILSSL